MRALWLTLPLYLCVACKHAPPPATPVYNVRSMRPVRTISESAVHFINRPTPRLPESYRAGMTQIGTVHATYRVHMSQQGRVLEVVPLKSLGAIVDSFVIAQVIATWQARPQATPFMFVWKAEFRSY